MLKEIVESVGKVIFPFRGLKSKDIKELQKTAKMYDVGFDSTYDTSNPDEYKITGKMENIKKFLKAIGKEEYIKQI